MQVADSFPNGKIGKIRILCIIMQFVHFGILFSSAFCHDGSGRALMNSYQQINEDLARFWDATLSQKMYAKNKKCNKTAKLIKWCI